MGLATQCLLLVTCALYASAEEDCKTSIQAFATCSKGEVPERFQGEMKEAEGTIHDKINTCFTAQGCTAPDWTGPLDAGLDAQSKGNWKKVVEWWDSLENDKRHCVIAEVRGDFKDKLADCIDKKIPNFRLPGVSTDSVHQEPEVKKHKKVLADHRFRIRNAMRKCEAKASLVRTCMKKERQAKIEAKSCEIRKTCAASLSAPCQQVWISAFKSPICGCVGQVAAELRKNVDTPEAQVKRDDAIKVKCGVELPKIDAAEVTAEKELHQRIKDYVSLFEDRVVPFCHECDGLTV